MGIKYLHTRYCRVCNVRCDYVGKGNIREIKTMDTLNKINSLGIKGNSEKNIIYSTI